MLKVESILFNYFGKKLKFQKWIKMSNKESLVDKEYQRNVFKTTRHLSIDCQESCSAFKTTELLKRKMGQGRKLSVPLIQKFSLKSENSLKNIFSKAKNFLFIKETGTNPDVKEKKKTRKKIFPNRKYSPLLQGRIISHTLPFSNLPLLYPATPDLILEHHSQKAFLTPNEEWVLIELNEYECLVDALKTVSTIAMHSIFFEVDPHLLWEEFFDFVEEAPSYDDVINEDIWQEFRDKRYCC